MIEVETNSCEKSALGLVLCSQAQPKAALALIRRVGSSSSILSSKSNAGSGKLQHNTAATDDDDDDEYLQSCMTQFTVH